MREQTHLRAVTKYVNAGKEGNLGWTRGGHMYSIFGPKEKKYGKKG